MNPLYLLAIIGLAVMTTTKVTIQSAFGKKTMKTNTDALFYNTILFGFAAAISLPLTLIDGQPLSLTTVLYGASFGILSIIFQLFYANAFKAGSVSLTVLINNFALVIPIIFGILCYGEPLTINRIIGIILLFFSLFFSVERDSRFGKFNIRWLVFTLICFFTGGICSIIFKLHQHTASSEQRSGFVLIAYFIAFALSILYYFYQYKKSNEKITYKLTPKMLIPAAVAGIILGLIQKFSLFLVGIIDSSVIFPILNCTVTILMTIFGVVFFKDKLKRIQLIGIAIGLVSIVLISI